MHVVSSSASVPESLSLRSSKAFAISSVAIAYLLIEVALWSYGTVQLISGSVAAAWILICTLSQSRGVTELGLGTRGLRESSWLLPVSILAAAAMVVAARMAGTLHVPVSTHPAAAGASLYLMWATEQQFIVQSFLFVNMEQAVGTRQAIVISGVLFAFAHIPNPVLMVGTLIAGLTFSAVFARYRNIWPLAVAHALLGMTVSISAPDSLNHHMRVGIGYLRSHHSAAIPTHGPVPPRPL